MFSRILKLPSHKSFFLFGPRGTGKSTLLRSSLGSNQTHWIDLLNPKTEQQFALNPEELIAVHDALPESVSHIVIDEIQKIPSLLDAVHLLIEKKKRHFALTGSSARKLKQAGVNLLAGRASVYHLGALSFSELGDAFDLERCLAFGMLPKIWSEQTNIDRTEFLESYALTYLKEEIWAEHIVRNLDPFRRFLEVAAQCNGKIINFNKIARDIGASDNTVRSYYSILEDTLVGFFVEPFHTSFRKRLTQHPKFYFFDTGITRALSRLLSVPVLPQTSHYGEVFEHFLIAEIIKLSNYYHRDYKFAYINTKDGAEIDLVVDRPGKPLLLLEIKSSSKTTQEMLDPFIALSREFGNAESICLCQEVTPKLYKHVKVLHWKSGLQEYFAGG